MPLFKTSIISRITIFLVSAMLSISAMALGFNDTERLANQGDAEAQYNLGIMYMLGESIPQDDLKALEWFQQSADQGNAEAQYSIALIYLYGFGLPQNDLKALEWFQQSADRGNAEAQLKLGISYLYAYNVDRDESKALKWFQKSAIQENAEAQYYLGTMYNKAEGVQKNLAAAKYWYSKACDNGLQEGCNEYEEVNDKAEFTGYTNSIQEPIPIERTWATFKHLSHH